MGIGLEVRVRAAVRDQRSGLKLVSGAGIDSWDSIGYQGQGWGKF